MPRPFPTCSATKSSNAVISNASLAISSARCAGISHHAVAVAEDDVAGKYRRVAAADRTIDLDRLMQGEIGRRAGAVVIGGKAEPCDLGGIAKPAVGNDTGDAALLQPRHQDGAGGGGASVLAAVHHQHRAGRAVLDG